ncbi:pseudouridine synthase [Flavihumibacter petaseus]|uniref:Pseudouridine synthase n=1 Tax=Flavihumibacter petaseus NBRC 106054 TaxID=1220578 RepID=A0A0E9N5G1_9BACT|nr:pseudouridine synthase [Flavihumibacter petaseus]GAO44580.1 23S rRNA pseudouridine synthase RluF [Flavihumibacter petaseus NBRC 106054]
MGEAVSLNKFISDTGYCSRREADELIRAGRVLLNGELARPGNRYSDGDEVEVDGSIVTPQQKEKPVYLVFNKPVGITTTTEEQVAGNIISFIGYPKRIFPIGRLDKDSEGLIFLTNDGDIVNKMLRAGNTHEKEYVVKVNKPLAPGFAEKMAAGIPLSEGRTLPCKVTVTGRQTFRITLVQGLNRQIRRMVEYLGYMAMALQRVRVMHVKLDKLPVGKWRHLSDAEQHQLFEALKTSDGSAKRKAKRSYGVRSEKMEKRPGLKKDAAPKPAPRSAPKADQAPAAHKPKKKADKVPGRPPGKAAAKVPAKGSYKAFRGRRK